MSSHHLLPGLAIACAIQCSACGDDELWQLGAATEVRELELLRDVPVVRMSREEFAAQAEQNAANIDDAWLQYFADTYGRMGFFDRDLDLRPVFAASSDWVGASYSPSAELITLVGDARDDIIVHEAVHALQDQHFDLAAYDALQTSDSFLARRAVVEGDATLAQARFVMVHERESELDAVNWLETFDNWREFSKELLLGSEHPVVFLDYPSFVYTFGLEYSARNLVGVTHEEPTPPAPAPYDWGLQNQLYTARPPNTTQEILLRDIYLDSADPVVDVGLETVPEELAESLEPLEWDSLGEWYVYLLFFPLEVEAEIDARALAAAWDGDRVLFVRHRETQEVATLWASVWDDEDSAAAVEAALWDLYGRTPVEDDPPHLARGDDGELVWLERRGNQLVAARNLDLTVAAPLVEAAFAPPSRTAPRRRLSLAAAIERARRRHP